MSTDTHTAVPEPAAADASALPQNAPLQSALNLIVDRARRITQANGAAIREIRGERMVWLARTGIWFREQRYARKCLQTAQVVNCATFRLDSSYQTGILSNAVVPILINGRAVAVLEVFSTEAGAFDADDITSLTSIASWAANVLTGASKQHTSVGQLLKRAWTGMHIYVPPKWRPAIATAAALVVLAAVVGDLYLHGRPHTGEQHERAGTALLNSGKLDAAVSEFKTALRVDPGNARAHYDLGAAYFRVGNYQSAVEEFRNALRLQYNLPHAHSALGAALLRQNQADAAIIEFYQAIRDDFSDCDAHYYLGVLLSSRGMTEDAINEYSTAIRFKADHAPAHAGLAVAYLQRGSREPSLDAARRDFDRAWEETHIAQSLGTSLDPSFLADLRGHLPDPAP